jgi:hypothetical protein
VSQTYVASRGAARGVDVPADYFPFRRKVRTIVQVYDVLRHTSQFHFEKTFNVGARSSQNDRKFVVTWPEPMNALTELYTQGSRRDGRIELAGLNDAQRQQVPYNQRQQLFGRDESILCEHSFAERDPQDVVQLRRALQSGSGISLFGDEVSAALKGVFDFNFSRYRREYREFYRVAHLSAFNVFQDTASRYVDPIIGKEEVGTDIYPDGVHFSITRMHHLGNRLIVLPARQKIGDIGVGGGNQRVGASGLGSRGQNIYGNVPYYRGGLAFWVKFEFDGDDPVFSGLLACTQVIKEVVPAAQDYTGSEGTQFFIFKNTKGQLRVVRMYYHQAFPEAGGGEGGGDGGLVQLFPDPGLGEGDEQSAGAQNPIFENLDQQKTISRADLVVDVSHFKAHEWHHIALDWDDQNPAFPIRIYIDFAPVQQGGGRPFRPQQLVDGTANSWCRLNQRQPIDGLQIGGIVRHQGVADAGVFKWYTSSARVPGGGAGVRVESPTVKRIIANATIDEFIVYEGTFPQVKRYYATTSVGAGYFTQLPGEYANLFEIPLPADVDHVILKSFDWTSYYPATYTDSLTQSSARPLDTPPITCELYYNSAQGALPPAFDEPWRRPSVRNQVAGRRVYRRQTGIEGVNADFVYKFRLQGARSIFGNTAGGVVQTPVIDDVTLSYYLPNPKVLLQEDAD